eukprot:CAMPEP_0196765118 /NCGR_PEP_ID=MMETSP1095-20130614/7626_1 /TAXON_ID=96789 ORGANISM="Chromulina nebulosa, Strain UTEXLB2642" /NCGR_SAMPLE_ID=MMETSP1095 /ASSEMBLY_ACC=CAM_ASM_000446 /LENGTH=453 /DNA_ID=CAMNT_0042122547 /DNA_START=287 /DNA_END=1648 /DNA_ORIENTATION=+
MILEAQTQSEFRLWLHGLIQLCPNADTQSISLKLGFNNIAFNSNPRSPSSSIDVPNSFPLVIPRSRDRSISSNEDLLRAESKDDNIEVGKVFRNISGYSHASDIDEDANSSVIGNPSNSFRYSDSDASRKQFTYVESKSTGNSIQDHRKSNSFRIGSLNNSLTGRLHDHIMNEFLDSKLSDCRSPYPNSNNHKKIINNESDEIESFDINSPIKTSFKSRQLKRIQQCDDDEDDFEDTNNIEAIDTTYNNITTDSKSTSSKENVPKSKVPPPPTSAPPRRARDVLNQIDSSFNNKIESNDNSNRQRSSRSSIDELIDSNALRKSTVSDSDDDDPNIVDFKAERMRYEAATSTVTSSSNEPNKAKPKGKAKPPRPPSDIKHPYGNVQSIVSSYQRPQNYGSSPPRRGDPGIGADKHFVNEDWDDIDVSISSKQKEKTKMNTIPTDQDWLNDDFDK